MFGNQNLPEKFGLVFDGWSSNSTHFVCLFAVFPNTSELVSPVLLTFSSFENESDLSAKSYEHFINSTLNFYKKSKDNVLVLVSDNCNVNLSLASLIELPFVGCASHRFNLAVKLYLEPFETVLKRINDLMKKLNTIKGKAWLKEKTKLRPVLRNVTRWSSTFKMVERYIDLKPHLENATQGEIQRISLSHLTLCDLDNELICNLFSELKKLNQVCLKLQEENVTLSQVRIIFDYVVVNYPIMEKYLAYNVPIVQNITFEQSLVKLQNGDILEDNDVAQLKKFEIVNDSPVISCVVDDFVTQAFKKSRASRSECGHNEKYIDTSFIPPTSNICEHL